MIEAPRIMFSFCKYTDPFYSTYYIYRSWRMKYLASREGATTCARFRTRAMNIERGTPNVNFYAINIFMPSVFFHSSIFAKFDRPPSPPPPLSLYLYARCMHSRIFAISIFSVERAGNV